jgi:ubiquinone/menaquinone biosynthesis C-methylase UbiE
MDEPDVDRARLRHSLSFICLINRMLGYMRATLWHFERLSRTWEPGQAIHVLDVATGSADIPRALAKWGRRRGFDLRIVGLDRHPLTARFADERTSDIPNIRIIRGDALSLPFACDTFDYVITNMFLHHLEDDQIVRALKEMDRVARRGIVAADLLRHRRAYAWITLLTLFSTPMLKHDARLSVAQALTRPEVLEIRRRAGVDYAEYFRHTGHRFVLAGDKREVLSLR